ncbi:MAG: penicillin-binding transpeptidase domain-containing protein, partial [Akkermansiaceae bacterium]|nr:penicillin-binding transpeptidase domain-containing protein [Akkermansiaceae bacterium]
MAALPWLAMGQSPAPESGTQPETPGAAEAPPAPARSASDGSIQTRRDARAITQRIPAPRGQITDRAGKPLAQNKVAYLVALQYRQFENADRDYVVNWARVRLTALEPLVKNAVAKTDDELWDHYRHRRWLPLYVSGHLDAKEAEKLEKQLPAGLELFPVYLRHYPENDLAAHIIGYTGVVAKMPTGPINANEPMWEESEGRAGLEKIFDAELTGEAGQKRIQFDEHGNLLLNEQTARPRVGGTVVTTLNLDWQRRAEAVLRKGCQRGAFVVLDVITGEVLVMASRPAFDLNLWVPRIDDATLDKLNKDPATPLYGRAFQSKYPPASAFKPVVALTALNNGKITSKTAIDCPAAIKIGNHFFNDWSKSARGGLTVRQALTMSNNPWFIKVGLRTGPTEFLGMARRLGMGERSGLPLIGETAGLVPDNEWMLRYHKRRIMDGDTANMSIGQG